MAFLCPVRIRSQKHKKKKALEPITIETDPFPGRVTGSSSVETLVKVGLPTTPQLNNNFVVLHDFSPCVDDELEVKRGDLVQLLYRENDWAYVVMETGGGAGGEGFIPVSYLGEREAEKVGGAGGEEFCKSPEPHPHIVLYTFTANQEDDLTVHRGTLVTVLNKTDPDWFWVSHDNREGFVPSAFVFPFNYLKEETSSTETETMATVKNKSCKGTELVMLYDYKAQAPDDLSVRRGDWVYADLGNQTVEGWLWAWGPKVKKYGFLPKAYARVPAMTSL